MAKLATHFGVTVGELLGYEKPERKNEEQDENPKVAQPSDGLADALEALRNQPGRRALLAATKTMTEAQVLRLADWISDLRGDDGD